MGFLLQYGTLSTGIVLFVGVAGVLFLRGKRLPLAVRVCLWAALLALLVYFAFVVLAVVFAGSAVPPHEPQPIPA